VPLSPSLAAALRLLEGGALFELYGSPAVQSIQLWGAGPTAAADAAFEHLRLWWCPAGQARVQLVSHSMAVDDITDVFVGSTGGAFEKAAQAAAAANIAPVADIVATRCFVLQSKEHCLALRAESKAVRNEWLSALRTVLENMRRRVRQEVDGPSGPLAVDVAGGSRASGAATEKTPRGEVLNSPIRVRTATGETLVRRHSLILTGEKSAADTLANVTAPEQPEPSGKQLVKLEKVATEKAQLMRDIQLTLVQMTHASAELLRKEALGAEKPFSSKPATGEFSRTLKFASKDFTYATASPAEAFEAKAYSPTVYSRLRALYGIGDSDFLASVAGKYNDLIVNSKSGSFFFHSADNAYLLKSCTVEENKALESMLPAYFAHLLAHPDSLLIKLFGSFRVKLQRPYKQTVHFLIMRNVFNSPLHKPIHVRFDLKGSTYGRAARENEKEQDVPVLKDIDFFEGCTFPNGQKLAPTFLHLGTKRSALITQLENDAEFLRSQGIIDYSLLVGIHYHNRDEKGHHLVRKSSRAAQQQQQQPLSVTVEDSNGVQPNGVPAEEPDVSPSSAGSTQQDQQQTHFGTKPHKEIVVPRQLLRKATMVLMAEEDRQAILAIGNSAAAAPAQAVGSSSALVAAPAPAVSSEDYLRPIYPRRESHLLESDGGVLSESEEAQFDGTEDYFLGIIDVLQSYTNFKKFEHTFKSLLFNAQTVSCTDPYAYSTRFLRRISSHLLGDEPIDDDDDGGMEALGTRTTVVGRKKQVATSPASQRRTLQGLRKNNAADETKESMG